MTPSASAEETNAENSSVANQTAATTNQNQVIANNSDLNGSVTATPYYKNEVQAGTAATTAGYDASARNLKQSMEAAGVSGRSGVAQGDATSLGASEAGAEGQVKTNAYSDTEAQKLAANSQQLTASGQQSSAATSDSSTATNAQEQNEQIGSNNWASLGKAVTSAAAPFTAGGAKALFGG